MHSDKSPNRTALIDGLLFVIVGLICLVEAYRLNVSQDANLLHQELQPGFYIFLLGFALAASGVAHLLFASRSTEPGRTPSSWSMKVRPLYALAALVGYAVLIELVGYLAATIAFFLAVFWIFGVRSWLVNLILSAVFGVGDYLLFVHYLTITFPPGILFG
jgi:hypothetical protein